MLHISRNLSKAVQRSSARYPEHDTTASILRTLRHTCDAYIYVYDMYSSRYLNFTDVGRYIYPSFDIIRPLKFVINDPSRELWHRRQETNFTRWPVGTAPFEFFTSKSANLVSNELMKNYVISIASVFGVFKELLRQWTIYKGKWCQWLGITQCIYFDRVLARRRLRLRYHPHYLICTYGIINSSNKFHECYGRTYVPSVYSIPKPIAKAENLLV